MGGPISLKQPSVVIAGYYGFGNAGDELILYALIRSHRRDYPEASITVLSKNPLQTARAFGVRAVDRWRPWSWMMPLLGADRFILGGGGLLQESTGPWNPAYYLSLMVVAKLLGCYTEVKAIGVDPLRRPANRFWTRFVLNHWADLVSVRDEPSRQALVAAGVHPAIGLEPDPVFELRAPQNLPQGKGIALALSPSPAHPQWGREVSRLCDRLAENGCSPIDLLVFFPEQDAEFCRTVASFSYAVRHVRLWQNPQDLVSWITEYQMVIGTRFHALVLAAANQIPFVGWGTQKKVISLCQACGKPSWNPDEEAWFLARQMKQILALYQSRSKSVILAGTD